jgi:hypothetical protein
LTLAVILVGCGGTTVVNVTSGEHPATVTETSERSVPGGNTGPSNTGEISALSKHCSSGLDATEAVSCELANNLFYEYYKASRNGGDTSALSAWSPATKQYYSASCVEGTAAITCHVKGTSDPSARVQISRAALDAYSPEQASKYASTHDTGPSG